MIAQHSSERKIRTELMTENTWMEYNIVIKGVTFQTAVTCLVPNMAQAGILVWVMEAAKLELILA